jgi:predicted enzyme related to lactoylglutathione lyase
MNRPVHFEIHAENPERAAAFYRNVFGWDIKQWGTVPYWMVMTGSGDKTELQGKWGGIDGGLLPRKGAAPVDGAPVNAWVCTTDVENIDETIAKVEKEGGKVALAKELMAGVGYIAYYKDTEGNIFGMIQALPQTEQAQAPQ